MSNRSWLARCRPQPCARPRRARARPLEQLGGVLHLVATEGKVARPAQPAHGRPQPAARCCRRPGDVGLLRADRLRVVMRYQRRELLASRRVPLEPLGEVGMERAPRRRKRGVGDLPGQRVLEQVLALALERGGGLRRTKSRSSRIPRSWRLLHERRTALSQNERPTTAAACSAALSGGGRRSMRAAITAWIESGTSIAPAPPPTTVVRPLEHPAVEERLEHLLHEERVALGAAEPARAPARQVARDPSSIRSFSAPTAARARLSRRCGARRPTSGRSRSSGPAPSRRAATVQRVVDRLVEQLEQRLIGPVEVLDDDDGGRLAATSSSRPTHAPRSRSRASRGWSSSPGSSPSVRPRILPVRRAALDVLRRVARGCRAAS